MKLIRTLLLILTTSFACAKPPTVKVLLLKEANSPVIEVKGRYQVVNPYDGVVITSGLMSKRYPLSVEEFGLKWGEKFPGAYQLRLVPGDSQSSLLVNGIQYKGCIEVYSSGDKIDVINEVDIESYLKSTLTAQFPEPVDDEVMNALVIVERTNLYSTVLRKPQVFWHIDAKEANYQGIAMTLHKGYVDRAVDATRHAVLTLQNKPFAAAWTTNSAGATVDFPAIFRKSLASPHGVQAPLAAKVRENFKWSFTVPKEALARTVNLQTISSADLYLAPHSTKVYAVKLSDGKSSNDIDFFILQKVLGAHRLLSTDFTVALQGDTLVFTGYGEGAGVGLCLYSAKLMAEKGDKAPKILSTFFPETTLQSFNTLEAAVK